MKNHWKWNFLAAADDYKSKNNTSPCRQAEELLQSDISYRKDIWQTSAMMLKQNVEFSFIKALKFWQNVD